MNNDRANPNDWQLKAAQSLKANSRSFTLASRFLPAPIRGDVQRLYAWCRCCDDVVDRAGCSNEALIGLTRLREDIWRIRRGGEVQESASLWLRALMLKYQIPEQIALDLLKGMETDLYRPRLENESQLLEYSYQVAGTVGLMMCRLLGAANESAWSHANSLGIGMQLTNIARDVGEDWRMGRRYVPRNWLPIEPDKDPEPSDQEIREALQKILSLAESHYRHGLDGLKYLPARTRLAIRVAATIYREIGRQIERENYSVMSRRVTVPQWRRLILVAKAASEELRILGQRRQRVDSFIKRFFSQRDRLMNSDAKYLAYLGLSLTSIMGAALFLMVGINPKQQGYELLPWIYSALCVLCAVLTGWAARVHSDPKTLGTVALDSRSIDNRG